MNLIALADVHNVLEPVYAALFYGQRDLYASVSMYSATSDWNTSFESAIRRPFFHLFIHHHLQSRMHCQHMQRIRGRWKTFAIALPCGQCEGCRGKLEAQTTPLRDSATSAGETRLAAKSSHLLPSPLHSPQPILPHRSQCLRGMQWSLRTQLMMQQALIR